MTNKSLKPLAITFFAGGLWDSIASILYFFFIGTGRIIDKPPINSFFAVFLGSFFLCFAYLQFLSSFNIRLYSINVGCLIIGRIFYVVQLYLYMGLVKGFPLTFWFTGIIDGFLIALYLIFAYRGGLGMRDLFIPKKRF